MSLESVINAFQFGQLEKHVQDHLKNVYATLGLALLSCAVGGYTFVFTNIIGGGLLLLSVIASIGLVVWLIATPPTPENQNKRFGILMGFSLTSGIGMGPLLDRAIELDPTLVPTAFLATSMVFICFSLAALFNNDRKYIALGGTLMSGLMWLLLLSFMNIFFGSQLLFQVYIYLGLFIMCGFVLYDTQLIVEKRRQGSDDFIGHALDLFIDFINIFRRILVILMDNSSKKESRRRRD